jgi:threonine/homoserine/homoserine lactone efflux protein
VLGVAFGNFTHAIAAAIGISALIASSAAAFSVVKLVDLLNPKTALFFLAFLPQFVEPSQGALTPQMLILGAMFTSLGLVSDGAYAVAAGTLGRRLRTARAELRLRRASGVVFMGLGVTAALAEGRTDRS